MTALTTRSQLLVTVPMAPLVSVHPVVPTSGEYGRGVCEHETDGVRDCSCTEFTGRGVICQTSGCGHPLGMHHRDADNN